MQLAGKLAVDGVFHHHIHHLAAVVHHDFQLPGHSLPIVNTGHGIGKGRALLREHIAPRRGGDGRAPLPAAAPHLPQ